jgi:carbamoyl-phosphate synthase small subunit
MMSDRTESNRVRLALSSGEVFEGWGFGAHAEGSGEVVFNTAMSGYEESLTDPSYMNQILVQTMPMIGNTGMNERDMESRKIQVSGMLIHEHVDQHSNYRASGSLHEILQEAGVPGISGIDTRALTSLLRSQGVVQGVISSDASLSDADLVQQARSIGAMVGADLAASAGRESEESWEDSSESWKHLEHPNDSESIPVGVIDCGVKENILRCLVDAGCKPVVYPISVTAEQIEQDIDAGRIHGLFLSNGPGDPESLTGLITTIQTLLGNPRLSGFPIFGICLGHQILALAMGASTYKLKFGHRGINHPVFDSKSGRVEITSQNHGFAVDESTCVGSGLIVTHRHLNDDTVAGIEARDGLIAGMQFHPEASPGPHDADGFFTRFAATVRGRRGVAQG